jgi:hypothetical protein
MGDLINLHLLRRARRIFEHFVGDGIDLPTGHDGQPCTELIDQTVTWCCDWLERRGGRSPSPSERRIMRQYLVDLVEACPQRQAQP